MPLSRFRLRLTVWFGGAFFLGLAVLNLFLFLFLHHREDASLTARLQGILRAVSAAILRERADPDTPDLASAVREALHEFPDGPNVIVVDDPAGTPLGSSGPAWLLARMPARHAWPAEGGTHDLPGDMEGATRIAAASVRIDGAPLTIAVATSTAPLREHAETLAAWMFLSAPLTLLLSLAGGYFLSTRALQPIADLGARVSGLPARDLDARLPVALPLDEVGHLAVQFNGLLQRVGELQQQNRRFLGEAAHQLRTPLTLVLGESELALVRGRTLEEQVATLRRIQTAARHMTHRVNDLFLLARAGAGEQVPTQERIDLDGLVLEVVDLFRARAHQLRCRLELGTMTGVEVFGNSELLGEAILELLENAGRHGESPVRISVDRRDRAALVAVENPGPPVGTWRDAGARDGPAGRGLGLHILEEIARVHAGALRYDRDGTLNRFTLQLPLA